MKYAIAGLLALSSLLANAQERSQNVLLDQGFWRNKPEVEAVKAEVVKGADPAQMNPMAFDPVVLAINSNAPTATILYLLGQKGNTVDKRTHDGRTYMFWAASKGNLDVMDYLSAHGAKSDIIDDHGIYVASFAAVTGQQNPAVYEHCIKNGARLKTELNREGANVLLLAVMNDTTLRLTAYLQSKGLDIKSRDAAGHTAFDYAAKTGNMKMMAMLLDKGVRFSDDVMLLASQGSRRSSNGLPVFEYLERTGAKPTARSKEGDNPLHHIARRAGQQEIIRYFISKGADPAQQNEAGNTVFMEAAGSNNDTATLALLLPYAQDINRKNKAGETALTLAARGNSADALQFLISHGADVKASDAKGNNLGYHLFESYNRRQAREFSPKLEVLSRGGYSLNTPQGDGSTVYHLAVAKNDLDLLRLIEPYKVDVNARNKEGLTALHRAAMMSRNDAILKYLISIGADKTAKTDMDETAFELARDNEFLAKEKTDIDFLK